MSTLQPKVGMGIYILNENHELLLFRRKGDHAGGMWCAPGGHLEHGETFLECAIREAKEECDLDVKSVEIIGVVNNIYSPEKHYVNVDVIAHGVTGIPKITEPDKSEDMGWFSLDSLPSPLLLSPINLFKTYPGLKDHMRTINSFMH